MKRRWIKVFSIFLISVFTSTDVFVLAQEITPTDFPCRNIEQSNLAPLINIQLSNVQNIFRTYFEDSNPIHINAAENIGCFPNTVLFEEDFYLYGTIFVNKEMSIAEVEEAIKNGRIIINVITVNISKAAIIRSEKEIKIVNVYEYNNPSSIWGHEDRFYTDEELEKIKNIKGIGFRIKIPMIPLTSGLIEATFSVKTNYDEIPHFVTYLGEPVAGIWVEEPAEKISPEKMNEFYKRQMQNYINYKKNELERLRVLKLLLNYANRDPLGQTEMVQQNLILNKREIRELLAGDLKNFEPSPVASDVISLLREDKDKRVREKAEETYYIFLRKLLYVDGGIADKVRNPAVSIGGFAYRMGKKVLFRIEVPEVKDLKTMDQQEIIHLIEYIPGKYKDTGKLKESDGIIFEKLTDLLKHARVIEALIWETLSAEAKDHESIDEFLRRFMKKMNSHVNSALNIVKILKILVEEKRADYGFMETEVNIIEKELNRIKSQTKVVKITNGKIDFSKWDLDNLLQDCKKQCEEELQKKYPDKKIVISMKIERESPKEPIEKKEPELQKEPIEVLVSDKFDVYVKDILKNAVEDAGAQNIEVIARTKSIVGEGLEPIYTQVELSIKYECPNIKQDTVAYLFELYTERHEFNKSFWSLRRTLSVYGGRINARLYRDDKGKKWTEFTMQIPVVERFTIFKSLINSLRKTVRIAHEKAKQVRNWTTADKRKIIDDYSSLLDAITQDIDKYNAGTWGLLFFLDSLRNYRKELFETYEKVSELKYLSDTANFIYALKNITKEQILNHLQGVTDIEIDETLESNLTEEIKAIAKEFEEEMEEQSSQNFSPKKIVEKLFDRMKKEDTKINFNFGDKFPKEQEQLEQIWFDFISSLFATIENNAIVKWCLSNVNPEELQKLIHHVTRNGVSKDVAVDLIFLLSKIAAKLDREGEMITASSIVSQIDKENKFNFKDISKEQLITILNSIVVYPPDLKNLASEIMRRLTAILASSYRSTETMVIEDVIRDIVARYEYQLPEISITYDPKIKELGEIQAYKADLQIILGEVLSSIANAKAEKINLNIKPERRRLVIEIVADRPKKDVVSNVSLFNEIERITGMRISTTPPQLANNRFLFTLSLPIATDLHKVGCDRWKLKDKEEDKNQFVHLQICGSAGTLRLGISYDLESELGFKRINVGFVMRMLAFYIMKEGLVPEQMIRQIDWDDQKQVNKLFKEPYLEKCVEYAKGFLEKRVDFVTEPMLIDRIKADQPINGMPPIREQIKAKFTYPTNKEEDKDVFKFVEFLHTLANQPVFYNTVENFLWQIRTPIMASGKWNGIIYISGPRLWKSRPGLVQVVLVGAPSKRAENVPIEDEVIMYVDRFTGQEERKLDLSDLEQVPVIRIDDPEYLMHVSRISEKIIRYLKEAQRIGNIDPILEKLDFLKMETVLTIETAI